MTARATEAARRVGSDPAHVIEVVSPATGERIGEAPICGREEVQAVVARARRAQAAWAVLPVAERAARLIRFREALVERQDELVDVVCAETGKPRAQALAHELAIVCDLITHYAKRAPEVLAPRAISLHLLRHRKSTVHYVPRGVVAILSPWNYPLAIPLCDAVFAWLTGSAAVVKPSEATPLTMRKAKAIFDASGLPEDLLGVVTGYGATGEALLDAGVQKVVFTGGVETGRKVAAACGARLIPCVLELGGKAPLLACADADVERTARAIVFGGFVNAGQACIAVERVYLHAKVHDGVVERVVALTRALRVGDGGSTDAETHAEIDVGPLVTARQLAVVEHLVEDAVAKGAVARTGGHRLTRAGRFYAPTILTGCTDAMAVMTDEIFGPVVPIQRVASEEEALTYANRSHLGLNAYVFTEDRARGAALARRVQAGSVLVNEVLVNYGAVETPFGGVKQSGIGRVHGDDALRDMAEARHVNEERFALPAGKDPLGFPHTARQLAWMKGALAAAFGPGGVLQIASRARRASMTKR